MKHPKRFITQYITNLGFDNQAAEIYYALLSCRQLTILELSRQTGIERTKLYSLSQKLVKRGLIQEVRRYKKRFLLPCNVSKLELLLKEELGKFEFLKDGFETLQSYIYHFQRNAHPTKVIHYHDKEGIKQMVWNELEARGEICAMTYRSFFEVLNKRFAQRWNDLCEQRKIRLKDLRSIEYLKSRKGFAKQHDQCHLPPRYVRKFIDPEILTITTGIDIYNDTVAVYNWHKGNVYGVELYNEQVAESFRQMYNVFWNMAEDWDLEKLTKKYARYLRD